MIQQLDLMSYRQPAKLSEVERLCATLYGRRWVSVKDLMKELNWPRRKLRIIGKSTMDVLSGPGSPGYILLLEATLEEVNRYTNARASQGREMMEDAIKQKNYAHARMAGANDKLSHG